MSGVQIPPPRPNIFLRLYMFSSSQRSRTLVAIVFLVIALPGIGCDKKTEPDQEKLALKIAAEKEEAVKAVAPPPATEEAILDSLAAAIDQEDIEGVKRLVAPELKADIDRMHRADPGRLWRESKRFAANIRSGFRITHRDDSTRRVWRVLVKFGNGQTERIDFTRVDGTHMLIVAF